MPRLNITNNGSNQSGLSDPATLFFEPVLPGANAFDITDETLRNLEGQLDDLSARTDSNGDPVFDIDVTDDDSEPGFSGAGALAHYMANKVNVDTVVSNPTTASTVSARRVNVNAGEAMVDGALFIYAASADEVGEAEIDKAGADVAAVDLATDEDVWMHVLFVNNAGTRETVFVRGDGVDNTGSLDAETLTNDELAAAVQAHLGASAPVYAFVEVARVLFEESTGLTQTTTSLRPAPPQYE